jgi:hypothetical protein
VRDHLPDEAEDLLKHRFGIVNVWRPIRGPVQDSPLALCDARSFTDDDLIASDLVYAHVRGETSRVEYNSAHRWYYFSEQQTDEVLFIRVHDSANEPADARRAAAREHRGAHAGVFPAGRLTGLPDGAALPRHHRGKAAFVWLGLIETWRASPMPDGFSGRRLRRFRQRRQGQPATHS